MNRIMVTVSNKIEECEQILKLYQELDVERKEVEKHAAAIAHSRNSIDEHEAYVMRIVHKYMETLSEEQKMDMIKESKLAITLIQPYPHQPEFTMYDKLHQMLWEL